MTTRPMTAMTVPGTGRRRRLFCPFPTSAPMRGRGLTRTEPGQPDARSASGTTMFVKVVTLPSMIR